MKRFLNYIWGGYLVLQTGIFVMCAILVQMHWLKQPIEISVGAFWGCVTGANLSLTYILNWYESLKPKIKLKKYIFEYSVLIPADNEYEEKKLGTFSFDIPLDILPDFMAALKTANEYRASGVEPIASLGIIEVVDNK